MDESGIYREILNESANTLIREGARASRIPPHVSEQAQPYQFVGRLFCGAALPPQRKFSLRVMRISGATHYLACAFRTAFFGRPLPSRSSALRTALNSASEAVSARGNRRFNASSALTMAEPITTRANHL